MSPVTEQPKASSQLMSSTGCAAEHSEKDSCGAGRHMHKSCHAARLRRTVIPAFVILLTTAVFLFVEFGDFDSGVGASGSLLRRATGTGNGNQTGFVKNKLYLIVVLVGLFLCLVAAIALAFWCCRGSFENPLCCPCYLCACCGGLACLECISCGLCAEGIEDLNV